MSKIIEGKEFGSEGTGNSILWPWHDKPLTSAIVAQ